MGAPRWWPLVAVLAAAACGHPRKPAAAADTTALRLMTPQDLQALPSGPADRRSAYGRDSSEFGELRVPSGPGPHPVVILVHGGCFKAAYASLRDFAPMGDALKADGIASWNIEYRRLGQPGGGWPGTYLDVGRAVDHLRTIAAANRLAHGRVVPWGTPPEGTWRCGRRRGAECRPAAPYPCRGHCRSAG
jgi:acetyl esterase/lipase